MLNWLKRSFPPPRYLTRPAVGLDISDRSVKLARLTGTSESLRLADYASYELPPGTIVAGEIKNMKNLSAVLQIIRRRHRLKFVVAALPEEKSYLLDARVPAGKPKDFPQSLEYILNDFLKLPPEELEFDYELLPDQEPTSPWRYASVSVTPKTVVSSYVGALLSAGLVPLAFELEPGSLARLLALAKETVMIVDIGKVRSSFYIVANCYCRYSATVETISGDLLTAALANQLSLPLPVAEQQKITGGLIGADQRIGQALTPLVQKLAEEITKRLSAWQNPQSETYPSSPVSRIILTGGQSTLPGLEAYLANQTKLPTAIGNPWRRLPGSRSQPPLPLNQAVGYSTAFGLALRNTP